MNQLFATGGQSIGASASVLSLNIQDWFPLKFTGWISLQSKGLSRVYSSTTESILLVRTAFFMVKLSYPYMTMGKTITLTVWTCVGKVVKGCKKLRPYLWKAHACLLIPWDKAKEVDWNCLGLWLVSCDHSSANPGPCWAPALAPLTLVQFCSRERVAIAERSIHLWQEEPAWHLEWGEDSHYWYSQREQIGRGLELWLSIWEALGHSWLWL